MENKDRDAVMSSVAVPSLSEDNASKIEYATHFVALETPVIHAKVTIYEAGRTAALFSTETEGETGKWRIPKNIFFGHTLLKIIVSGGEYKGQILQTDLCALATDRELREGKITVDAVSTLLCSAVDKNMTVKHYNTVKSAPPFNFVHLSSYLYASKIEQIFLDGITIEKWREDDTDNDGLTNWNELLNGLNPSLADSDNDTLNDGDEINLYDTNPAKSDTDNDYLPDNVELSLGKDPLVADENNNQIVDGLEGDPFFKYQWYIHSVKSEAICTTTDIKTVKGNDLNILPLYHRTLGNSHGATLVQVVDGGVDAKHEDLNVNLKYSTNSVNNTNDPSPVAPITTNPVQVFYRGHGTAVAGIIGAKGFNGKGVRGVAPLVQLAGSNWLEDESIEKLESVWYMGEGGNEIAISNNSWGAQYIDDKSYEYLMEAASEDLRDGKGRIFVFASGNDREQYGNANLSYLINNPYAIAVSALNQKDHYASYSTPGSNVITSAYGGEHYYEAPTIMTTFSSGLSMNADDLYGRKGPLTLDEDEEKNYTFAMNGTSAAAPMVSGALALVLDVCPSLTWRDVRWLIAHTSTKVDVNNSEWIQNGATLWHNNNYGFGKINAVGIVNKCTTTGYKNLSKQIKIETVRNLERVIPDTNESIEESVSIDNDLAIEWVGLTVGVDHPYAGDLNIELISPSGTVSHIIEPNFLKSNAYKDGFRFSTVSHMGESSKGNWIVRFRDALAKDEGKITSIKLEIWGHKR